MRKIVFGKKDIFIQCDEGAPHCQVSLPSKLPIVIRGIALDERPCEKTGDVYLCPWKNPNEFNLSIHFEGVAEPVAIRFQREELIPQPEIFMQRVASIASLDAPKDTRQSLFENLKLEREKYLKAIAQQMEILVPEIFQEKRQRWVLATLLSSNAVLFDLYFDDVRDVAAHGEDFLYSEILTQAVDQSRKGNPGAIEILLTCIRSQDPIAFKIRALEGLEQIAELENKEAKALHIAFGVLEEPDPKLQQAALQFIASRGRFVEGYREKQLEKIVRQFDAQDPETSRLAAMVLSGTYFSRGEMKRIRDVLEEVVVERAPKKNEFPHRGFESSGPVLALYAIGSEIGLEIALNLLDSPNLHLNRVALRALVQWNFRSNRVQERVQKTIQRAQRILEATSFHESQEEKQEKENARTVLLSSEKVLK